MAAQSGSRERIMSETTTEGRPQGVESRPGHPTPSPPRQDGARAAATDESAQRSLIETVGRKEGRKLRARQRGGDSVWFGLGMFGIVGWSVAVPMLALLALGMWIDGRWPSPYSWTLMCLLLGIGLGCANAWYWITRERRAIEAEWRDESRGDLE